MASSLTKMHGKPFTSLVVKFASPRFLCDDNVTNVKDCKIHSTKGEVKNVFAHLNPANHFGSNHPKGNAVIDIDVFCDAFLVFVLILKTLFCGLPCLFEPIVYY